MSPSLQFHVDLGAHHAAFVNDVLRHHMAVTVGFEPTVDFHPHNFSRVAPSAARTRHR